MIHALPSLVDTLWGEDGCPPSTATLVAWTEAFHRTGCWTGFTLRERHKGMRGGVGNTLVLCVACT